jgi:2-polyprenyl-3-methyl-5-hydroxy-6-metoxy-1,4-benzoquinol methylase
MPRPLDTAPLTDVRCPLGCSAATHRIVDTVWEAPEAAVYECAECSIVFVHPMMDESEERSFYEADFAGYMKHRGAPGQTDPAANFEANEGEGLRRLANLEPFLRPGMRVLELGSATGFLLDAVAHRGAASVTGVEPGSDYRAYANERGIRTVADLAEVENERFDLILAYYVVEHLRDPISSLSRLSGLLDPGGLLAVEVPNVEDALVSFYRVAAFDRFYWQKAHCFNYSRRTLAMVLQRSGFDHVDAIPEQRYDISNHVHWLTKGEPGGKGKYTHVFDERLNSEYARVLKEHWLCDTVFAVAHKGSAA